MCIVIRASSLSELFDCPARWEAKHLLNMRLPAGDAARLGTAVHAGTALFDQSRLDGTPLTPDESAGAVVDVLYDKNADVDWGDSSPSEAESIAVALHRRYCRDIAPHQSYVAVEAACERLEITDLGIALTGTTDRVFCSDEGYGIADIKTGKNAVNTDGTVKTQGHAAQTAVYELLAEQTTGIRMNAPSRIIGLQTAKTEKGRRAGVGEVCGGRELLLGDGVSPGLLEHAAAILHRGLFPGNPRSLMCGAKYCPVHSRCKWRR